MSDAVATAPDRPPLDLMREVGGYYECPKDSQGRRLGPLVGYAGRDHAGRQFVGDIYVNFAQAERRPALLATFSRQLMEVLRQRKLDRILKSAQGFCGAPEGGKAFAYQLALDHAKQYIYPEKKITAVASAASREISELVFSRHEPGKGETWFIVEDVCNNFSTTSMLVALIESFGAKVGGVLCFLNRSSVVQEDYAPRGDLVLPVVAVVQKPFKQFAQDDAFVAEDLARGNVIWSPKRDWHRLADAGGAGPSTRGST